MQVIFYYHIDKKLAPHKSMLSFDKRLHFHLHHFHNLLPDCTSYFYVNKFHFRIETDLHHISFALMETQYSLVAHHFDQLLANSYICINKFNQLKVQSKKLLFIATYHNHLLLNFAPKTIQIR